MKIYGKKNVVEAALERIAYIFNTFEEVIVGFSGGKDSTITLALSLIVARQLGRTPLKVMFLDQEAEWQTVIDYIRDVMHYDDVEPLWYQMPMRISNSTSPDQPWLHCWEEGETWMRERDSFSIKENKYGTISFVKLFEKIVAVDYPNKSVAYLSGVRAEENPGRMIGLTQGLTYEHITWGKILNKKLKHFTFYPLYDWSYKDIWRYMYDHKVPYCKIYDYMYQYGVHVNKMRVSNLHHETAIDSLYYLQEIESDTWNKLTRRLKGINTTGNLKSEAIKVPDYLPYMFDDWIEYRNYLINNLVSDDLIKQKYLKYFKRMDTKFPYPEIAEKMVKAQISTLLHNDYHFTKLGNWQSSPEVRALWEWKERGTIPRSKSIRKKWLGY